MSASIEDVRRDGQSQGIRSPSQPQAIAGAGYIAHVDTIAQRVSGDATVPPPDDYSTGVATRRRKTSAAHRDRQDRARSMSAPYRATYLR